MKKNDGIMIFIQCPMKAKQLRTTNLGNEQGPEGVVMEVHYDFINFLLSFNPQLICAYQILKENEVDMEENSFMLYSKIMIGLHPKS